MNIRERMWQIALGPREHKKVMPLLARGGVFPPSLTDPSATEFVETQESVLRSSREQVEVGAKDVHEHERLVQALLGDAHAFLARYGDTRPARHDEEP
jgi:hypothetical protein